MGYGRQKEHGDVETLVPKLAKNQCWEIRLSISDRHNINKQSNKYLRIKNIKL